MPLYQLFAIAKPTLPLSGLATTLRSLGGLVFSSGGVVTDITSFGEQELAYPLKTQAGKYTEAQMMAMDFHVSPKTLAELDHSLRVNEDVLRWVVLKKKPFDRLPRTAAELETLQLAIQEARAEAEQASSTSS
mmetsp:Transcript_23463/g.58943  ORF Transcript_23463/g.58943 Transcript_23463/m.58943 type:complete len:133 (+) Transcript_23463:315-713(+)